MLALADIALAHLAWANLVLANLALASLALAYLLLAILKGNLVSGCWLWGTCKGAGETLGTSSVAGTLGPISAREPGGPPTGACTLTRTVRTLQSKAELGNDKKQNPYTYIYTCWEYPIG